MSRITDEMIEASMLVAWNRWRIRNYMNPVESITSKATPQLNQIRSDARAIIEAAAPMIRDAALEEAAIIAGVIGPHSVSVGTCDAVAAAIRAMKEQKP